MTSSTFELEKVCGVKNRRQLGALLLGCVLTLIVMRVGFVNYFDSAITRFGCMNQAAIMSDPTRDLTEFGVPHDRVAEIDDRVPIVWSVRSHVRSNKLGLLNRDSASCTLVSNSSDLPAMVIPMADAHPGGTYWFGKFVGIIVQIGAVAAFIRWFNYRFVDDGVA